MKGMSNLIDRFLLLPYQFSILIDCIFFQEVPDLISRGQKILVPDVILFTSCELNQGMLLDVEVIQQLLGPS